MAINVVKAVKKLYSLAQIFNDSWDDDFHTIVEQPMGYDGQNIQRTNADNLATKVTVSGATTYIGIAAPGSSQSSSVWQCCKIDQSSGTVITWADGNCEFDNTASDLTALTYS